MQKKKKIPFDKSILVKTLKKIGIDAYFLDRIPQSQSQHCAWWRNTRGISTKTRKKTRMLTISATFEPCSRVVDEHHLKRKKQ